MEKNLATGYSEVSSISVEMTLTMQDGTTKTLPIAEGDVISNLVFKDDKAYKTISGIVKSINFKTKAGSTGTEICPHETDSRFNDYFTPTSLTIDYSSEYDGKVIVIPLSSIKDFDDHVTREADTETGISIITTPNAVPEGTTLVVSVSISDEDIASIETSVLKYDEEPVYDAYDISLDSEGVEVQPNGTVTVTIPVNEEKLASADYVEVRHILDDGAYEVLPATISDGQLSFSTSSFSYFLVMFMKNPVYELKTTEVPNLSIPCYTANGGTILVSESTDDAYTTTLTCGESTIQVTNDTAVNGGEVEKNIKSTEINMTGGKLTSIYGLNGHLTNDGSVITSESCKITVTGGEIYNAIVGSGLVNSHVKKAEVVVGGTAKSSFAMGGGMASNGKYSNGTADAPTGCLTDVTDVTVKGNAKVAYVYGGPQGYGTVSTAVVNISDNAEVIEVVGGGSNGLTETAIINIYGGTIYQDVIAVNRGTVRNVVFNIYGGKIGVDEEEFDKSGMTYLNYGASDLHAGCGLYLGTTKESSNTTGNIVSGSVTLLYHDGEVPVYFGTGLEYPIDINLYAEKALTVKMQTTADKQKGQKLAPVGHTVPEGQTIYVHDNVTLEVPEGMTVVNNGRIILYGSGTLVVNGTLEGNEVEYAE